MTDFDAPKTPNEAIQYLDSGMSPKERQIFSRWGPVAFHDSLGRQIRNSWGLWADSPLKRHFNEQLGIGHADDMSAIILCGLEKLMLGQPVDWDSLAEPYRRYWLNRFIDPLTQKEIVF